MVDRTDNIEAEGNRRRRQMEIPADLESRFLRVGDKLYRSAHDKEPVATITADRIKAKDQAALPDLIRLAKENGWTSLKISGDEENGALAFGARRTLVVVALHLGEVQAGDAVVAEDEKGEKEHQCGQRTHD